MSSQEGNVKGVLEQCLAMHICRRDVSLEESREKCFQGCLTVTTLPARGSSLGILGLTCMGKRLLLCSGSDSEEKSQFQWYLQREFGTWRRNACFHSGKQTRLTHRLWHRAQREPYEQGRGQGFGFTSHWKYGTSPLIPSPGSVLPHADLGKEHGPCQAVPSSPAALRALRGGRLPKKWQGGQISVGAAENTAGGGKASGEKATC